MSMSLSCFIHLGGQKMNKKSFDGEIILLITVRALTLVFLCHFLDHSQTMLLCARQCRWWGQGCQGKLSVKYVYITLSKYRFGLAFDRE